MRPAKACAASSPRLLTPSPKAGCPGLERLGDLDSSTVEQVRTILLEDGDLHPAVRTSALLLVGHHGDNADREWIRDLYNGEFTPWVRRAILYAIRHLPKSERNHF